MDLGLGLGFTNLLRLAWIASILPILVASLPIRRLRFFHRMLSSFAARGKIIDSSSRKFTVPQRYFLHFYVVAVVLTTFLALATWFYACRQIVPLPTESSEYSYSTPDTFRMWRTVFVLHLMEAQVARRLYETAYVFRYGPNARMHIFGYLAGLFFYTVAPLSLGSTCSLQALRYVGGQIAEFIVKSQERIPTFELNWWKPFANLGWCQWIGFAIFIWGWLHQFLCHAILGSLREDRRADEYMIPHGDWFEYVSCPHYLAEIVIYAGILVASGGSDITIWLLFLFVVSNLVFAAAETHRWYCYKFDNYPRSRRAIIPLIY